MWPRSVKAIGLSALSKAPTYGCSFQDILQLSVNQCQSVNTATFTWHPPVFARWVETDRWAGESGKPCPHARTECFNLLKDRNMCNCSHNSYAYNSTHLLNRQVRDANIARSARKESCVERLLSWEQAWHLLKVLHVPLLFWFFKSTHYASPTASFNTIITPSRGSQREGPSVTANRAASLAALSLCLQAISRCVSAPLNCSRGKSIKAGVREENPIKRCAWFPQHERSPRGFIQQSERHEGGLQTYINCITAFTMCTITCTICAEFFKGN